MEDEHFLDGEWENNYWNLNDNGHIRLLLLCSVYTKTTQSIFTWKTLKDSEQYNNSSIKEKMDWNDNFNLFIKKAIKDGNINFNIGEYDPKELNLEDVLEIANEAPAKEEDINFIEENEDTVLQDEWNPDNFATQIESTELQDEEYEKEFEKRYFDDEEANDFIIGNQNVFALPNCHLRQIPGREHLDKFGSIWALNLHLPLNSDITQNRIIYE